jgi:hypothetical protein
VAIATNIQLGKVLAVVNKIHNLNTRAPKFLKFMQQLSRTMRHMFYSKIDLGRLGRDLTKQDFGLGFWKTARQMFTKLSTT